MDETDGKRQLSVTWVTLAYFYVAALIGLVVVVISSILLAQFIFSGDGEGIVRSAAVFGIGAAVSVWHMRQGLARQERAFIPMEEQVAEGMRRSRITLAYYYAATLVGVVTIVIGLTGAVSLIIDAIMFDDSFGVTSGLDLIGPSDFLLFNSDRSDLIAGAFGRVVSAAIGFGVARWHYDRAQGFEHQG